MSDRKLERADLGASITPAIPAAEPLEPRLLLSGASVGAGWMPNRAPTFDTGASFSLYYATTTKGMNFYAVTSEASDRDGDSLGVAIVGLDGRVGRWEFTTDSGSTWSALTVPEGSARLLRCSSDTRIRVTLAYDRTVEPYDWQAVAQTAIQVRVWDQTRGTNGGIIDATLVGGSASLSENTRAGHVDDTRVRPVPLAEMDRLRSQPVVIHTGATEAAFLRPLTSTPCAVVGVDSTYGQWSYRIGSGAWQPLAGVSVSNALSLWDTQIQFTPNDGCTGAVPNAVRVMPLLRPNSTSGLMDIEKQFPCAELSLSLLVTAPDAAPVLDASGTMRMESIRAYDVRNRGSLLREIVASAGGDRITTADPNIGEMIAITWVNRASGLWEYSASNGKTWKAITDSNCSERYPLMLRPDDATRIRFVPAPGFAGTITNAFRFRAAEDMGTTVYDTQATDHLAFSAASETVSLIVNLAPVPTTPLDQQFPRNCPDNHAPEIVAGSLPFLPTLNQGDMSNRGALVREIIDSVAFTGGDAYRRGFIRDLDGYAVHGLAVIGTNNEFGQWQYSRNDGETWRALTASPTAALMLAADATTRIRFIPNADFTGAIENGLTVRAWDRNTGFNGYTVDATTSGGATALSVETAEVGIAVRPDSNGAAPAGDAATELVWHTDRPSYIYPSAMGPVGTRNVAIIGADMRFGRWEYDAGTGWQPLIASAGQAFVLSSNTELRFVPVAGFTGVLDASLECVTGALDYSLRHQTVDLSVRGGDTGWDEDIRTIRLIVRGDTLPALDPSGEAWLSPITQYDFDNNGNSVAEILASLGEGRVFDADGDCIGMRVVRVNHEFGTWQFSEGHQWRTMYAAASGYCDVLLDPDDRIRFVPKDGAVGTISNGLIFYLAQYTPKPNGYSFAAYGSAAVESVGISVLPGEPLPPPAPIPPNNAPYSIAPTVSALRAHTIVIRPGDWCGEVLAETIALRANSAPGIAITGVATSRGQWEYSADGVTWHSLAGVSDTSARLLRADAYARIRFVPDPRCMNLNQEYGLTFRTWNCNTGMSGELADVSVNGGRTSFSQQVVRVAVEQAARLVRPELDPGVMRILVPDQPDPYQAIPLTSLGLTKSRGIVVLWTNNEFGRWEYRTGGGTWQPMEVSASDAMRFTGPQDSIRFVPSGDYSGILVEAIKFVPCRSGDMTGWTDATIRGENTSFGLNECMASLIVHPPALVNRAPQLQANPATLGSLPSVNPVFNPAGAGVTDLVWQTNGRILDADAESVPGIAVTGAAGQGGAWQYSLNGGKTWKALKGYVSAATLLPANAGTRVRFLLTADYAGTPSATLSFRAWDGSQGVGGERLSTLTRGGTTAISLGSRTLRVALPQLQASAQPEPDMLTLPATSTGQLLASVPLVSGPRLPSTPADMTANTLAGMRTSTATRSAASTDPAIADGVMDMLAVAELPTPLDR